MRFFLKKLTKSPHPEGGMGKALAFFYLITTLRTVPSL